MTDERKGSQPAIDTDKRLSPDDTFRFECGPHVPCFTECCRKLELLLTPYDALRLSRRLGMTSAEFLDAKTIIRRQTAHGFPEVLLMMDEERDGRCPFVTEQGCSVYDARPAACRIYPLGRAAGRHPMDGSRREFYFTVREDHCRGFEQARDWKVGEWIQDQGMEECNRINDLLMDLYVLRSRKNGISLTPQHIQMFMMSCYNLERFRDFIFKSGFLTRFDLDGDLVQKLRDDDISLLEFAFTWLRFALFREPVLTVRQAAESTPQEP